MEDNEYKYSINKSITRDICAFLNTNGGRIYVGLNNKGEVIEIDNIDIVNKRINILLNKYFGDCLDYINVKTLLWNDNKHIIIDITKKSSEESGYVSIFNEKENKHEYYFRVNNKNIKTDKEHAPYWEIVGLYDLPINKDYGPSNNAKRKALTSLKKKNNVSYKTIGNLPSGNYFYKYMTLEAALKSLDDIPSLRFVEPTSWEDQYEGRFYNAIYNNNIHDSEKTPFLYACCFSSKHENEAAWVLYSHNNMGLASRCVEFTINRDKLREQLVSNLKDCSLYIGAVDYKNKYFIDNIHKYVIENGENNPNYSKYFYNFSLEQYLNLLLLKRTLFEHEKEIRIFIIPNNLNEEKTRRDKNGMLKGAVKSKYVNIDWLEILEDVKIDENCSEYEISLLQRKLNNLIDNKCAINKLNENDEETLKLRKKLQLKKFNPYKDDSLKEGALLIDTNQIL